MHSRTTSFFLVLVMFFWAAAGQADERLWMQVQINGRQARMIFDTGADRVLLFPKGASRLGLRVTEAAPVSPPEVGQAAAGVSETCELTLGQTTVKTLLSVLDLPSYLDVEADGVVGWNPISKSVVRIDASSLTAIFLPEVPAETSTWPKFCIRTNSGFLFLEVPGEGQSNATVLVDTGCMNGVALAPHQWREWRGSHARQPTTLDAYFMPGAGLVVTEEMWAPELVLGALLLTDVPVGEANPAQFTLGAAGYQASLGLAALKRLDMVVDGGHGVAYLRLRRADSPPYEHNRLGAVFVPPEVHQNDLVAHVVPHGPAYEAGIRNGDVLLKIDKLDVTEWRTGPGILPLERFWTRPPGTRLHLTLKRQGDLYQTTVLLREILRAEEKLT